MKRYSFAAFKLDEVKFQNKQSSDLMSNFLSCNLDNIVNMLLKSELISEHKGMSIKVNELPQLFLVPRL